MNIGTRLHPIKDKEIIDWLEKQGRGFNTSHLLRELLREYILKLNVNCSKNNVESITTEKPVSVFEQKVLSRIFQETKKKEELE